MISELFVQISRSRASPVFKPSHTEKCMLNLLLKIYQNHYFHGKHNHLIRHMGWRKDRGGTDCPNNSTPIRSGTEQQLIDLTQNQSTISTKFARAPQNQSH